MRILFFSHYFPPEVNAPASRTYEHCVRWVRAGHDVTVITCAPNCPDGAVFAGYRNRLRPQLEMVDGIQVIRVWTYLAPNAGTTRRIGNYLSYMASAVLASLRLPRPDVVLATSPQFFCGWAGVLASRLKRVPLVLEIRDIWPESIQAVGAMRNRWLLRVLERLERWMYLAARHIVAVGDGYRDNILRKVDVVDRISVIMNGVDLDRFVPMPPDQDFLRRWGLEGKFVCSYVGTIGMAHGLEVVVKAAGLLKAQGRDDIRFCVVGDGARRKPIEQEARQAGTAAIVRFTGLLPKEAMPAVLASSDACLIHLKKCELFGTVIPSKMFEMMAMAKPIIMGVEGQARELVVQAGAAVAMEPDSAESLVAAVEGLAGYPHLATRFGQSGRRYVSEHFSRDAFARIYLDLLARVAGHVPTIIPNELPERRKAA
ncbi:MAG: glycosyltransferase family 4 protein [Pirellulales bacterium]|nr:glycosyltransferase family 4 protein [Pirellulales bacterium]